MTPRQKDLLDFVRTFIEERGFSPSYEEIMAGLGLASKSGVNRLVEPLVAQGRLLRQGGRSRCLTLPSNTEIDRAVNAERARWQPAITYFERYCQDEADERDCCISDQQHEDAKAFAAVARQGKLS